MNEHIAMYIAKRKAEIEKEEYDRKAEKLKKLGIGERQYSDFAYTSEEFPFSDPEKHKSYKVDPGEFTDEEYEEVMKYAPKGKYYLPKKRWLAVYLIWVCLHFILLIWGAEYWSPGLEDFLDIDHDIWPFSEDGLKRVYDISEFLVYSLVPLVVYWVIRLFKESKVDELSR